MTVVQHCLKNRGYVAHGKSQNFEGFGCSECQWVFNPTGTLVDKSFDQMKQPYEAERDKEFLPHVCATFPRVITPQK
jgi:hypothetical protein